MPMEREMDVQVVSGMGMTKNSSCKQVCNHNFQIVAPYDGTVNFGGMAWGKRLN